MSEEANYGVAKLASTWQNNPQSPNLPFSNIFVYLCGNFKMAHEDLTKVLIEGSATMLRTLLATSSKIKDIMNVDAHDNNKPPNIIVCGDSRVSLTIRWRTISKPLQPTPLQ
jgi:hypothetical protein